MNSLSYILWDWNGTLLNDIDAEVAALNLSLARRGLPAITKEFFRERFAFPARSFYRLVGMDVPDCDWDALAKEYHDNYATQARGLAEDAIAALELVSREGGGQSIISALHQRLLEKETADKGVSGFMEYTYGVDNLDGGSKLERAQELVDRIRADHDGEILRFTLIGDSLHDADVAAALGVGCVLYSGGSHAASRLAAVAPTCDTLVDAVSLALQTPLNSDILM